MTQITSPIMLDSTGQLIANSLDALVKQEKITKSAFDSINTQIAALSQEMGAEAEFTLEQSSNPAFSVSDTGIAQKYIGAMGGYGIIMKNGQAYAAKLNTAQWDRFADGTLISAFPNGAADFETMVKVPDCYIKGNSKTAHFGGLLPVVGGHKFDSPNWVGAYEMYVDGNGVGHSRPDVSPSHSRTMSSFWSCAQQKGNEWGLANYQFHCLINALYQARYGNLNSQATIGAGGQTSAWNSWRDVNMGLTRSLGDGTGNVLYNDETVGDQYETKLFGFEGLWGKLWEFRPGIRFYMDGDVRHAVVYSGNQVSNSATGRDVSPVLASANDSFISQMHLGEWWDMIPQAVGGSDTTYYCDGCWAVTSGELLLVGGSADDGSQCGVSYSYSYDGFGHASAHIGARLAFYGQPIIVSGSELLSLLA